MSSGIEEIAVNTTELGDVQQQVMGIYRDIRRNLEAMEKSANDLNGMWEGPTHDEFNRRFSRAMKKCQDICKQIEGQGNYEEKAKEE